MNIATVVTTGGSNFFFNWSGIATNNTAYDNLNGFIVNTANILDMGAIAVTTAILVILALYLASYAPEVIGAMVGRSSGGFEKSYGPDDGGLFEFDEDEDEDASETLPKAIDQTYQNPADFEDEQ